MLSTRKTRLAALAASATALGAGIAIAMPLFSDWAAPANLETLPGSSTAINTAAIDGCASQTKDGLTLFFNSNRAGSHDIYMAKRSNAGEGFGNPVRLPPPVNTDTGVEACPTYNDGKLYFVSTRDDPTGDLVVSTRTRRGWSDPVNLGSNINRPGYLDESAAFFETDDGHEVMLFSSRSPAGDQGKIYQSVDRGPATLVAGGANGGSASDNRPSITHDGLTIFFDSNRNGTLGDQDLWYATRSSSSEPFGDAVHLTALSSLAFDARPFISWYGKMLTFSSARTGSTSFLPDIWFSSRTRTTAH
jgi:hypothetical protein